MKKTEPINTFDKLFSFTKLKAILEVYVLILAIIGIYLTIGQFSIRYEPKVEIVDYIYVFNVNYLKGLIGSKSEYAKILNYSPTFKRLIDNYDIQAPIRIYGLDFTKRHQIRYILPYEVNDSNINREGWSNNSDNNTWFRLGLDSLPMDTTMFYIYNSAGRSNEEKKIGISLLFTAIVLNDTNLIKRYPQTEKIEVNAFGIDTLGSNPLQELKSNIAIDTNNIIEDFLFRYSSFSGMRIYTLTSISNISNSPVENLNLFINQSTEYAPLKIEGWTSSSSNVKLESSRNKTSINIDLLESNRSIEFLLSSNKVYHEKDFQIGSSFNSGYDTRLISFILLLVLFLVILFYLIDYFFVQIMDVLKLFFRKTLGHQRKKIISQQKKSDAN